MGKKLDSTGLSTLWGIIKSFVNDKTWGGIPLSTGGRYAVCNTSSSTAAKTVSMAGFVLKSGAEVLVRFTTTNTAAVENLTLNVNSTGAKNIRYRNAVLTNADILYANRTYSFVYDGTYWQLIGDLDTHIAITGSGGTTVSSNSNGTITINSPSSFVNIKNTWIQVQTNPDEKRQRISVKTFMDWLKEKGIIFGDSAYVQYRNINVMWSYADNDILQFTSNGVNYELDLAGAVIEFIGGYVSWDSQSYGNVLRMLIHSNPKNSLAPTSGYKVFPSGRTAIFTFNGSAYNPTWTTYLTNQDISLLDNNTIRITANGRNYDVANVLTTIGSLYSSRGASTFSLREYTAEGDFLDDVSLPMATTSLAGIMSANDKSNLDYVYGNFGVLQSTPYIYSSSPRVTYYQTTSLANDVDLPENNWNHILTFNHDNADGNYFFYQLALPFWGTPRYRRQTGSVENRKPWYAFITEENVSSFCLPLSGGTLSGSLSLGVGTNKISDLNAINGHYLLIDGGEGVDIANALAVGVRNTSTGDIKDWYNIYAGQLWLHSGYDRQLYLTGGDTWSLISFNEQGNIFFGNHKGLNTLYSSVGLNVGGKLVVNNDMAVHSETLYVNGDAHITNDLSLGLSYGSSSRINFRFSGENPIPSIRAYYQNNVGNTVKFDYFSGVFDGSVSANGFNNTSDVRLKSVTGQLNLKSSDIASMPAISYKWVKGMETTKEHAGTIAQSWQALLPEVISTDGEGYLTMDYASTALVSAIAIARDVVDHETRIKQLESENRELREEIEMLKNN